MALYETTMRKVLPLLIVILVLMVYLLWPFTDERWNIDFDKKMLEGKRRYLNDLTAVHELSRGPNIILITADDLGLMDISLYGGSPETPNIDSIANDGVRFDQGYATAAISAPSRAALLTGRDQNRFGFRGQMMQIYLRNRISYLGAKAFIGTDQMRPVYNKSVPSRSAIEKQGLPPSEICLAEMLNAAGYSTAQVGKWHLGYSDIHHPNKRGFDQQYGFIEAFSLYDDENKPDVINHYHDLFWEKHIWKKKRTGPSAITRNGEVIEENEFLTDAIARESVDFINRSISKDRDRPFFMYAAFNAPHTPFQAKKEYYDRFPEIKDHAKRVYFAMIAHMDDAIGRILKAVEQKGIGKNTLIMFSSDNGGATYTGGTTNAPLKGGKMTLFDGGLRVPFMMKWDGKIPPGTVIKEPVIQTDLFVTAAKAAGIELPSDRTYDGADLLPFAADTSAGKPHDILHWKTHYSDIALKYPWKLMINHEQKKVHLYNVQNDIGEKNDLAEKHSEIVEELSKSMADFNKELPPPLWPVMMEVIWEIDGEKVKFSI